MTRATATGALLLIGFLALGILVSGSVPQVDTAIADTMGGGWNGFAGDLATAGSAVLGPVLPLIAAVALVIAAIVTGQRGRLDRTGLLLRTLLLLAACRAVSLVKPLFERDRPRTYPDFSFPSGHVVSVASVAFTAVVLCTWLASHRVRTVLWWSVAAVAVAALCRVVLDVHWFTDVVGSIIGVVGIGLLASIVLRLLPPKGTAA